MEILHIFSVTGNKNRKIWQEMEVGCGENAACGGARAFFDAAGRRGRRPPTEEDFRVTFFYKPIDIVGFMCYHAITYKKDMLKE
ncbi:MAG: hypothetical protein U0M81_04655 [Oscillospiraceae bacterium]